MSSRMKGVLDHVLALLPLMLAFSILAADRLALLGAAMIGIGVGGAGAAVNLVVLRSKLRGVLRYATFVLTAATAIAIWSVLVPFAVR